MTAAWSPDLLVTRVTLLCVFLVGVGLTLMVGWAVWEFLRWRDDPGMAPPPPPRRSLFDIRHANDFEAWEDELR